MKAIEQFENVFGIRLTGRKHLELLTMLLCLEIVLALSYLGFIQVPPISVTTLHMLVIVAAMYFGPWDAAAVAGVFAITSMWKASVTSIEIGDVAFSPILSGKPFASIVMALGTRIVFGVAAGYAFRRYFSRKREHPYLGISAIAILATLLHSLLVYVCMYGLFDAASVETSSGFDRSLILNNLLLYVITVLVALLCFRLFQTPRIRDLFRIISAEEIENDGGKRKGRILLYLLLALSCVFIAIHFLSRLGWYIRSHEDVSEEYLSWTYALVVQFIVGFIGVFVVLSIIVKWIQEYYSALALEANRLAKENAEIANKAKSSFLFNMSHDIRTPMNAILGYTDIALRHGDDPERVRDSLQKIRISGGHLLNLINDILEMSRVESGTLVLAEKPLDLRKAFENVEQMSRTLALPKSIEFIPEIGAIPNPYVLSDELHGDEVSINLISNAIKYTPPGGRVCYRAEQLGDPVGGIARYRFTVKDTGIGMSEEFQKHIFESFSREDNETVAVQEGSGLGLAIVKRIVDMAGGSISVESVQGKGSTFTVEIPMKVMDDDAIAEYEAGARKTESVDDSAFFRNRKVLLVEDNEMNREIAMELLEEAGFVIEAAEDGALALEKVAERGTDYYDYILMDIQMPVMDGFEATAAIRGLPGGGTVPIIALSANAFREDVEKSLSAGMNAHVAKPIEVANLLSVMRSLGK